MYLRINNATPEDSIGSYLISGNLSVPISYPFNPNSEHTGDNIPIEFRYKNLGTGNSYLLGSILHNNPKYFDINPQSLSWVLPNGGESLNVGDQISTFSWSWSGGIEFVNIDLVTLSGALVDNVALNIPNVGTHTQPYIIPPDLPTSDYKLKLYNYPEETIIALTDPIHITNPNSFELVLSSNINTNPEQIIINQNNVIFGKVKNIKSGNFHGSLRLSLIDPNSDTLVLATHHNLSLDLNDEHSISAITNFSTGSTGSYNILMQFNPMPVFINDVWYDVGQINFLNPQNINVLDEFGNCEISNPPLSDLEAHMAVQYLCGFGLIQEPTDGDVRPADPIIKEDLAKLIFLSLYDFNPGATTPADEFPVPFGDMQDQPNQAYARYGKVLSYLEYGDGVSPFNRRFFNYRPGSHLTRGEMAKVFIEAFDLPKDNFTNPFNDVPTGHPYFLQIVNLADLGIVSGSQSNFRPDDIATRGEVFIMLHRYLTQCPNCEDPDPVEYDYFDPGNYTPANLSNHPGIADANFDQYSKTSFYIPGRNLPMMFEHSYNSYLTELPDELFCIYNSANDWISFRPLGVGWSHSYNSYIQKIPGYSQNGFIRPDQYVVFWPDGSMHVYQGDVTGLSVVTEGIYDQIAYTGSSDKFVITKKNQIKYTYEQKNAVINGWPHVLTKIEDRNGNTVTIQYEPFSGGGIRIKRVIGTTGRLLTFNYQSNSNKINSVADPIGRTVHFTYGGPTGMDLMTYLDAENFLTNYNYSFDKGKEHLLTVITMPNGNFVNNTYEDRKLTSSKTNGAQQGNVTTQDVAWSHGSTPQAKTSSLVTISDGSNTFQYDYEHNELGKVTSVSTPTNQLDNTLYEDQSNPTLPTSVTIDGLTTNYEYDNNGNATAIHQPLGVNHSFVYNSLNDIETYTNPRGYATTFAYIGPGNLEQIITPIGTSSFEYTMHGQVKKVTNPEGLFMNITYDNYGNPNTISTAEGISSSSTYDLIGRVKTQTNPNEQTTEYDYDDRDFLTKVTDPMNYVTQYGYDDNGNLEDIINAKNHVTHMVYGHFDWLESITFGGQTKSFEYEEDGKLSKVIKPDATQLQYVYDSKGNLIDNDYATFTYDTKNRLKTVSKNGKALTYFYDNLHRITNTTYDGFSVEYDYDLNSNVRQITYPGNKHVIYTYDNKDRLKTVKDWLNQITTYVYLDDDRLSETIYPNNIITYYNYDAAGRMSDLHTISNGDTLVGYNFIMDLVGNHVVENKIEPFETMNYQDTSIISTYNDRNEILTNGSTSFTHDANGNIKTQDNRTYSWDDHDMLTSIQGEINTIYKYDGLRHRRESIINGIGKKYVLDILGMSQILMETDLSGSSINYFVYGLGLISKINPDNTTRYYHGDFRGSTIAMTDENGLLTNAYQYDAFGNVIQELEEKANVFKYVGLLGGIEDTENLIYMRARYYNPIIGRFISEDPIWNDNLYSYANNNPIMNIDPEGASEMNPDDLLFKRVVKPMANLGPVSELGLIITLGETINAYSKGDYKEVRNIVLSDASGKATGIIVFFAMGSSGPIFLVSLASYGAGIWTKAILNGEDWTDVIGYGEDYQNWWYYEAPKKGDQVAAFTLSTLKSIDNGVAKPVATRVLDILQMGDAASKDIAEFLFASYLRFKNSPVVAPEISYGQGYNNLELLDDRLLAE